MGIGKTADDTVVGSTNNNHQRDLNINDNDIDHEEEKKKQSSLSQKDRSNKIRLLGFQTYYVDDYVNDKEGRLEKKIKVGCIYIHFNFQESSLIPDININKGLQLHNLRQLKSTLDYYYNRSNVLRSVTDHSEYEDLQGEIDRRKTSQSSIDKRIKELSKYLDFTLHYFDCELTYTNLNRSTLPLAVKHLESILLVFKTGSYITSNSDEVDRFMKKIFKQYEDRLSYKPFQTHYTDSLLYVQPKLSPIMLKINLNFELKPLKHSLNKTLCIRNVDQFKAILRSYDSSTQQYFIPFDLSSNHKDIDINIIYRNTLQRRINKILRILLMKGIYFSIEEDEYDPLTLNLGYYLKNKSSLPFLIKHLELLTLTFKTGNDDENDRNAVDLYLSEVKNELLPFIKDESLESSGIDYYNNFMIFWHCINLFGSLYCSHYESFDNSIDFGKTRTRNINKFHFNFTFHFNLHIIFKQYQCNINKTLQLEEPKRFIRSLDYHNLLPNGYFPSSNSFDKSLSNLLYIFEQNEDNSSILNLYYYSLSDELDTSIIIKHLRNIISSFKILKIDDQDNINSTNTNTLSQYFSSITDELKSLSTFPSPTTSFQYHFINQYNEVVKSKESIRIDFHLRFLLRGSHFVSNTYPLNLFGSDQFLSLLHHYSLLKDPLDPSWIEAYREHTDLYGEITYRNRLQTSYDRVLSRLSERVSFRVKEDQNDPSKLRIDYIDLRGSDVPYAMKHLDTMMTVYKTGNHSSNDKLEVDNLLFLAKEDVEEGFSTRIDPYTSDRLDRMVSKLGKDPEDPVGRLDSKLDTLIASVNSISLRLGTNDKDDKTKNNKVSLLPRNVNAADGRLGGESKDIPNLLEVSGNDISMMEDID